MSKRRVLYAMVFVAALAFASVAACGDQSGTPSALATPTGNEGPPQPVPRGAVPVSFSFNGMAPRTVSVPSGGQIRFTNSDSVPHQPASDPHPSDTECPFLNAPLIAPGASVTVTTNGPARDCGMHDHLAPNDTRWKATVRITGGTPSAIDAGTFIPDAGAITR